MQVVQGELNMTAQNLTVFYVGDAAKGAGKAGSQQQQISRIEIDGGVTVKQKDQTATGQTAVYEAATQKVTLAGNVVLSQGANIVRGVIDIYYNKPFTIPALESLAISPELLDKYVGVYSTPEAPVKWTITRDGATLFFQPPGAQSAVPLEATAENKFQIEGAAVFEFDAAKKQMIIKRRGGQERVLTKEK